MARASAWMRQQAGAEPARARFFAWLHLFDPHTRTEPPPEFAAAHPGQPYDGEIAYTDAALGQLFDAMSAAGIFDRTLIVIVADHGEGLGEHGERTHGTFVYDSTIRVPLIVRVPTASAAAAPVVVDQVVETADIAPTLAALAKLPARPGLDGVDLVPLLSGAVGRDGSPAAKRETVYAETYYQNVLLGWSPLRTARGPDWKFIEAPRPELYRPREGPRRNHEPRARTGQCRPRARGAPARRHGGRAGSGRRRRGRGASRQSRLRGRTHGRDCG